MARRAPDGSHQARVLPVFAVAVAVCCGILLLVPANLRATADTYSLGRLAPRRSPAVSATSQAFGGVAPVGALFTMSADGLGTHFCTASVVHSTHGDLAITAAHCMTGIQGQVVFVPGYANGKEPYGVWQVSAVYTDQAWQSSQDPDDDIAFLRLSDGPAGAPVEHVTGAELLGAGLQAPAVVQVIGYPDVADQPITCTNWATSFSPTQLEFDCGSYTDGVSGGPFLADVSAGNGQGTVVGVIGGYEQGGDTPEVSYASAFGPATAALYQTAEAGG
ncbi:MAG TPA: trypsin-like serine protease [Trebonia sp.]|nr:trypsin-like serine protease [Trebonia sp.]